MDRVRAESTVAQIGEGGGRALLAVCNVSVRAAVDAALAATVAAFGGVDILVNAAFSNPSFGKSFVEQA